MTKIKRKKAKMQRLAKKYPQAVQRLEKEIEKELENLVKEEKLNEPHLSLVEDEETKQKNEDLQIVKNLCKKFPFQNEDENTVTFTPRLARAILAVCNKINRNLDEKKVAEYTTNMQAGKWRARTATVFMSKNGILCDSQHFLNSVVKSGTSQKAIFITGVEDDHAQYLDIGKPRKTNDSVTVRTRNEKFQKGQGTDLTKEEKAKIKWVSKMTDKLFAGLQPTDLSKSIGPAEKDKFIKDNYDTYMEVYEYIPTLMENTSTKKSQNPLRDAPFQASFVYWCLAEGGIYKKGVLSLLKRISNDPFALVPPKRKGAFTEKHSYRYFLSWLDKGDDVITFRTYSNSLGLVKKLAVTKGSTGKHTTTGHVDGLLEDELFSTTLSNHKTYKWNPTTKLKP